MSTKKLMYINRKAPYGTIYAWESLEVVLIGAMNNQRISVEDLALWAGTIPYEILTNINTRVPRVYKGNTYKSKVYPFD